MTGTTKDAGFSLIELLIVLAIVAGLSTLAAMSLRPSDHSKLTDLRWVVAEARSAAILAGTPIVITIARGRARWANKDVEIAGRLFVGDGAAASMYQMLAYPDGSYSGSPLSVDFGGVLTRVSGVYREGTR